MRFDPSRAPVPLATSDWYESVRLREVAGARKVVFGSWYEKSVQPAPPVKKPRTRAKRVSREKIKIRLLDFFSDHSGEFFTQKIIAGEMHAHITTIIKLLGELMEAEFVVRRHYSGPPSNRYRNAHFEFGMAV